MKCFIACIVFTTALFSCNKEDDEFQVFPSDSSSDFYSNNFFPVYTIFEQSGNQYGATGPCSFKWEGSGSEPRLGKFFIKLSFCCDLSTGCYKDAEGYFQFKDGDKLHFSLLNGVINDIPEKDSDYYQKYFKELALITGGTGIFKDASGRLSTSAMIHVEPINWKADCMSEGYLALTYMKNPIRDNQAPHIDVLKE